MAFAMLIRRSAYVVASSKSTGFGIGIFCGKLKCVRGVFATSVAYVWIALVSVLTGRSQLVPETASGGLGRPEFDPFPVISIGRLWATRVSQI